MAGQAVELDVLDGLDQNRVRNISNPGVLRYWCYIQCNNCHRGWIWRRKLSGGEDWTLRCYICENSWRINYCENGGWNYWDPIRKRPEF